MTPRQHYASRAEDVINTEMAAQARSDDPNPRHCIGMIRLAGALGLWDSARSQLLELQVQRIVIARRKQLRDRKGVIA